ncbi:MAG: tRNA (adenosine(37)-N6)-threonylcarbamoyltransferase complex dimerization subunit type 1 TsaB [Bacteroidales bacterium]|jgi:tRNA threonylcarbamoyladenosine biosynthesis protein TsaB|nr:tRNA (adenosine(37)-N6)-threonylcarbamoyltransferase complex dimerization subunit type 1 TsaB [Bacteroidales bacterium]
MALILSIETTTSVCSVALAKDGQLLSLRELDSKNSHAEILNGFIEEVLNESKNALADLSAVAVSEGPGSYTGLRIGVSTAKGLCYSLDIPLININTLQSLAMHTHKNIDTDLLEKENLLFCSMIDARRMEAYTAHYNANIEELRKVEAEIIDENTYKELLDLNSIIFSGDGANKYQELYQNHPNAHFYPEILLSAKGMIALAEEKFNAKDFADLAYFEPYYFKAFVAGIPRVKGLR